MQTEARSAAQQHTIKVKLFGTLLVGMLASSIGNEPSQIIKSAQIKSK